MQTSMRLYETVDAYRETILAAENYLWTHPETGYREWNTHAYLKREMEALGCTLTEAGDIPGFYTDIDTGRAGPKIGIFAEMDALLLPEHPESDPKTGAVHACAHHCQCAAMLGLARALTAPGTLDGLCGSVRLFAVPAEELIEQDFRLGLIERGVIRFGGGKQEFMARGYLAGVDIAMMIHTGAKKFLLNRGCCGSISKRATFFGKASHGASPARGANALYAATTALAAANALREQFGEDASLRFHPILTEGGSAVNVIPARVTVESMIRGGTLAAIRAANEKLNRAFAGGALAMGCRLTLIDRIGYLPRITNSDLAALFCETARDFFAPEDIRVTETVEAGCTDMGDVSQVIPSVLAYVPCSSIPGHTAQFVVEDRENACVTNAKLQAGFVYALLKDGAARAKAILADAKMPYASVEAYLADVSAFSRSVDAVTYGEDGHATVRW